MSQDTAVVIVAGGRGLRAGGETPKQYVVLGGRPVIRRTIEAFAAVPAVTWIQPVIHRDDAALYASSAGELDLLAPVPGGDTRQASVLCGLEALAERKPRIVLVHDAARPFVSQALIARAIEAARNRAAAVPALAMSDTIKRVDPDGRVIETLDRARLRAIQTPQAFLFEPLIEAHRKAARDGRQDFTDDAALAEWAGLEVSVFAGDEENFKITRPEDFARGEKLLASTLLDVRTGSGYDVHAFAEGDHVWLGGVRIAHTQRLAGHSDADVALHALVDAVLGALADGDIGSHFPPSDPQWRGASSDRFLAFAAERVRRRGGVIAHLDVVIVCEAPRIGPHRDAMRARIAEIAAIAVERVGIQATTNEKLGFLGRGEGIAALATATIRLPWSG